MNSISSSTFSTLESVIQTLISKNALIGVRRTSRGFEIYHAANLNPAALILNEAIKCGVTIDVVESMSGALISQKTKWGATRFYFHIEEISHEKEVVQAAITKLISGFKVEDGIASMHLDKSGLMVTLTPEAAEPNSDKIIPIFIRALEKYVDNDSVKDHIRLLIEDVDFSRGQERTYRFPRLRS